MIVVANKVDSERREADAWEFAGLGLGEPVMVSALHGRGVGDLLDEVVKRLPEEAALADGAGSRPRRQFGRRHPGDGPPPRACRPWRSSAARMSASRRCSTASRARSGPSCTICPGTTRDAIDTLIETEHGTVKLIDTAGMRRRARSGEGPEYYSLVRALRALDHADVALLVLDATEGVTHQDQRLAERIDASGSPVVILLNKWDLLDTAEPPRGQPTRSPTASPSSATRLYSGSRPSRVSACTASSRPCTRR